VMLDPTDKPDLLEKLGGALGQGDNREDTHREPNPRHEAIHCRWKHAIPP
jgi:hypothetical protein